MANIGPGITIGNGITLQAPVALTTTDSGLAEWYCFVSGTATYSCPEANTNIYQIDSTGTPTRIVAASSSPQRGTFAITAGYTYYGDGPIYLTAEDAQHKIAPLTMAYNLFIYFSNRGGNESGNIYIYAPYQSATVNLYKDGTGISGTPIATLSLNAQQAGTFPLTLLGTYFITSTAPVVGSHEQGTADKGVLSPATTVVYQRFQQYRSNAYNSLPTVDGTYVVSDSSGVMAQNIADGSGLESAQGLGYEWLSDSYSWGNVCSDYVIVAPYASTSISASYWNGSSWTVWDSHSLNGTQLSPDYVARDGTQGPGVPATNINGSAANMAGGANLWRWVGNNPFFITINDSVDDEVALLGWMSTKTRRYT